MEIEEFLLNIGKLSIILSYDLFRTIHTRSRNREKYFHAYKEQTEDNLQTEDDFYKKQHLVFQRGQFF